MRVQNIHRVGIYLRLSRDDGNSNAESMSIVTQKQMLTDYVKERGWDLTETYMQNYDIEQANLNHVIAEKRNTLMEIENASVDISAWAKEFKQYTNIDKLNRKIVTKLIDSVEVHESTKENGVIKQHVTVNYKFVGQLSA